MNDLQKYLTNVAIAAIRQEVGKIIAHPRTEIGNIAIAESLDELEIAFRELQTDQRFKAACDHAYAHSNHGYPRFYRKSDKAAAPTPAEHSSCTGDNKSELQA